MPLIDSLDFFNCSPKIVFVFVSGQSFLNLYDKITKICELILGIYLWVRLGMP